VDQDHGSAETPAGVAHGDQCALAHRLAWLAQWKPRGSRRPGLVMHRDSIGIQSAHESPGVVGQGHAYVRIAAKPIDEVRRPDHHEGHARIGRRHAPGKQHPRRAACQAQIAREQDGGLSAGRAT